MSAHTPERLRCEVCDMPTLGDTLCNLHHEEQEKMTHTPGPWEARYHLLLEEKRKLASLETLTEKQKLNLGQINNDLDCWYALREAAPAMLEALNSAVDELNIDGTYSATELMATIETVRANLREAIRLAEGEGVV